MTNNKLRYLKEQLFGDYFILIVTILYVVVLLPFIPRIISAYNLKNLFSNALPLIIIAVGQTYVLIIAGIDLSQTSIMAFSSVMGAFIMAEKFNPDIFSKCPLWGWFITESGGLFSGTMMAVPAAIIVMLLCGVLIGLLNGVSIAFFKMPAFIVTLVNMMLFTALAIYLPNSENILYLPKSFVFLGKGSFYSIITMPLIIVTVLVILAHLLLSTTLFGRKVYSVGTNAEAARVSGYKVKKIIICTYMISGFCAACGSILYTARLEQGRPTLGSASLLDIIGANIIAGVSLSGGRGKIISVVFGVFFFVILNNSLSLLNLPFYLIDIVKGLIILAAVLLDVIRMRKEQR